LGRPMPTHDRVFHTTGKTIGKPKVFNPGPGGIGGEQGTPFLRHPARGGPKKGRGTIWRGPAFRVPCKSAGGMGRGGHCVWAREGELPFKNGKSFSVAPMEQLVVYHPQTFLMANRWAQPGNTKRTKLAQKGVEKNNKLPAGDGGLTKQKTNLDGYRNQAWTRHHRGPKTVGGARPQRGHEIF